MQFKRSIFGYQDMGVGAIREITEKSGDGSEATIIVSRTGEFAGKGSGQGSDTSGKFIDGRTRKGKLMRETHAGRVNLRIEGKPKGMD